jgi:YfiH family protein
LEFGLHGDIYSAQPLNRFDWLDHGFGTRDFAPPAPLATLRQIHSAKVLYVDCPGGAGEGDALIAGPDGPWIGVKTADCLPILLVDERLRAVAAVHAGWRGTAARIAQKAVEAMVAGGSSPDDLHAAIGPGIGVCCFEVGPEVSVQFGEEAIRRHIDLAKTNARQLQDAGVAVQRVYMSHLCTVCHTAEFHSFRRDREKAGRQISVIRARS